jgi:hypothetical protein
LVGRPFVRVLHPFDRRLRIEQDVVRDPDVAVEGVAFLALKEKRSQACDRVWGRSCLLSLVDGCIHPLTRDPTGLRRAAA